MVSHFKGGYVKSIMKLFPEIGLDENKFYDYTGTSVYSSFFLASSFFPSLLFFLSIHHLNIIH